MRPSPVLIQMWAMKEEVACVPEKKISNKFIALAGGKRKEISLIQGKTKEKPHLHISPGLSEMKLCLSGRISPVTDF